MRKEIPDIAGNYYIRKHQERAEKVKLALRMLCGKLGLVK